MTGANKVDEAEQSDPPGIVRVDRPVMAPVPERTYTRADLLTALAAERHACSIVVWMTLMEALEPDADDKGLDGWMREAERRVKNRQYEHDAMELGRELYADAQDAPKPEPEGYRDCAECGKSGKDGWALYCVACMEKIAPHLVTKTSVNISADPNLLERAMKAETETALLRGEVDRLTEELDSANLARMVADVVKRDAYRYRKLLMQDKHWLGVFRCDPDGAPSDSISNDELSALLDAMDGPEMLPVPEAP